MAAGLMTVLIVGGIGVATGGTAFAIGIPAMMAIGGTTGGLVGAATGKSTSEITTIIEIPKSAPAYEPWMWIFTMIAGVVFCLFARSTSEKASTA